MREKCALEQHLEKAGPGWEKVCTELLYVVCKMLSPAPRAAGPISELGLKAAGLVPGQSWPPPIG